MNKEETRQILNIIYLNYPQSFRNWDKKQLDMVAEMWSEAFKEYPAPLVTKAVKEIIYYEPREFAPNIAIVMSHIRSSLTPNLDVKADEQWQEVRRFMQSITGNSDIDRLNYNNLDDVTRQIYTYGELGYMAQQSSKSINFKQEEFKERYKKEANIKVDEMMKNGTILRLQSSNEFLQIE